MTNFVGLLQEKCQQHHKDIPRYLDNDDNDDDVQAAVKRCTCEVGDRITKGFGHSKKLARQMAAELMLQKIEAENWSRQFDTPNKSSELTPLTASAMSKISLFCDKHKKQKPLISEKDQDGDLYVIEVKFDGYTGVGKGNSKKLAKDAAAQDVVKHFKIDTFYNNFLKQKKTIEETKNPLQNLHELCQGRKLMSYFSEETVSIGDGKTQHYIVTCTVKDLVAKSQPNFSKKNAKSEAATLMFEKLSNTKHFNTPDASPIAKHPQDEEEQSDNEDQILVKRIKTLKDLKNFDLS